MFLNDYLTIKVVITEIKDYKRVGFLYNDIRKFKKDHPKAQYKLGFIIYDMQYNHVFEDSLNRCENVYDSVDELLSDYLERKRNGTI